MWVELKEDRAAIDFNLRKNLEYFIKQNLDNDNKIRVEDWKLIKVESIKDSIKFLLLDDRIIERTENVNDVLEEGQELEVKLIGFDRGKMKLSMKALIENTE